MPPLPPSSGLARAKALSRKEGQSVACSPHWDSARICLPPLFQPLVPQGSYELREEQEIRIMTHLLYLDRIQQLFKSDFFSFGGVFHGYVGDLISESWSPAVSLHIPPHREPSSTLPVTPFYLWFWLPTVSCKLWDLQVASWKTHPLVGLRCKAFSLVNSEAFPASPKRATLNSKSLRRCHVS